MRGIESCAGCDGTVSGGTGWRSDGQDAFTILFSYPGRGGRPEGIPIEVSWNAKVGPYQEFSENEDPGGFKPELKKTPHRNIGHR